MGLAGLVVLTGSLLVFSLISNRLQGTILTAPLVFVVLGFALSMTGSGSEPQLVEHSAIHFVAELTLILVLFADAARIDLKRVRQDHNLPARMLALGLPLTMFAGGLVAFFLFPSFSIWEAALLAALLAPTDAALGQAVVSAEEVPIRIRQTINIESGLNDGIALPAVLLFAALASASHDATAASDWLQFGLMQVILGPIVGIALGYVGARLLDTATERGWVSNSFQGIGILSLAAFTYVVSEMVGGNGFIATFVGGMVFGNSVRNTCTFLFEVMETEGQLLMLITFFVFGVALLPDAIAHMTPTMIVYALLSLTVIRMIPITLSLLGAGLRPPSWLFLGWFGPRGLASILFLLLILEETDLLHKESIFSVAVITVAISVVLHGITAAPFARAYGRLSKRMGDCEENRPVSAVAMRHGLPDE